MDEQCNLSGFEKEVNLKDANERQQDECYKFSIKIEPEENKLEEPALKGKEADLAYQILS